MLYSYFKHPYQTVHFEGEAAVPSVRLLVVRLCYIKTKTNKYLKTVLLRHLFAALYTVTSVI